MLEHHYRSTGRAQEIRYVPTVRTCAGCRGVLARPHATSSYVSCLCPEGGHYRWRCFDPDCADVVTLDPPCELGGPEPVVGASDYFSG